MGGWAWAGNVERGPMTVWRGRGLLEMRTEETGVDPRKTGCDPNKGKVQGLEAKVLVGTDVRRFITDREDCRREWRHLAALHRASPGAQW